MVMSTNDGRVFILDLQTGKLSADFKGPKGNRKPLTPEEMKRRDRMNPYPVPAVAIQPRGSLAASAWEDGSIDLWRIADGGYSRSLKENLGRVCALAFDPEERYLAATYANGQLVLWNLETGTGHREILAGPQNAVALQFSPDGHRLVQAGGLGIIAIWDVVSGKRSRTLGQHIPCLPTQFGGLVSIVTSAAYSPDGRWLATGGGGGDIRLWDAHADYQLTAVLSVVPIRSPWPEGVPPNISVQLRGAQLSDTGTGLEKAVWSLGFRKSSQQLLAVAGLGEIRVYEMSKIVGPEALPKEKLVSRTQELTGLRLEGDDPATAKLIPIPHNHLAQESESLRKDYLQDFTGLQRRIVAALLILQAGRAEQARDLLLPLLREPGIPGLAEAEAHMVLSTAYLALGQYAEVEAEARRACAANPNDLLAHHRLALALSLLSRFDEAAETLQQVLTRPGLLASAEASTRFQLGTCYAQMFKLRQVEREFQRALEIDPTIDASCAGAASVLIMKWRFADARELLGKAIANPMLPSEMSRLTQIPQRDPQIDRIIKQTRQNIRGLAHAVLAGLYLQTFEPDKALAELNSAGDLPATRWTRISLLAQRRQFADAKEFAEVTLRRPDTASFSKLIRAQLPMILAEAGDLKQARATLHKLLDEDPNYLVAQNTRVFLDMLEGKSLQRAEARVRQLLEEVPDNLNWQFWLAWIIAKRGQAEEGLKMMEILSADEVMARNLVFWDVLGDTRRQCNQPEKARVAWQKALELFPKSTEANDHRKLAIEVKLRK
jgi:WD40 repeat protein/Tfp pilus assembly protein PilF